MRKILIVAPSSPFPEHKDGLAKINYQLMICKKKFRAELLCIKDLEDVHTFRDRLFFIKKKAEDSKAKLLLRWFFSNLPFNVVKYADYISLFAAEITRLHHKYDVIHISSPFLAPIIYHVSKDVREKLLLFPIDSMTLYTRRRMSRATIVKAFGLHLDLIKCEKYEARVYHEYSKVTFVSDVDAKIVKLLNSSTPVNVIPNGVDTNFFSKSCTVKQDPLSIIFTGDMSYAPNKDAAIFLIDKVMPLVWPQIDVTLYLVGQKPDVQLLKRSNSRVIVTGFVEDIRVFLEKAQLYVSPLRFGSGIKNKILEAMSMSKIVLGTSLSFDGISVESGINAFMVSEEPQEVAASIIKILKSSDQYADVGSKARELVEKSYSWDSICSSYGDLYESCIGN